MNIKNLLSYFILFVVLHNIGTAQSGYQFGLLPALNVNKKVNDDLKINFKSESRQIIYQNSDFGFQYDLIDFSLITSTKIGFNNSLAGGYLLRVRKNVLSHRLIQQFTINQKILYLRVAHRFSSDQTFNKGEETEFRLRYRISGQIPLSGQAVDPKEFYLKVNNEYLNSFQLEEDYDLEIRLALSLGYEFNDDNKIEFGIENRSDSFVSKALRNRSWLNLNWYLAI